MGGVSWCPSCGGEFRPGFTTCPDCRVALLSEAPPPTTYERDAATPWAVFRADLTTASRAWRTNPGLPVVTVCLFLIQDALFALPVDFEWLFLPTTLMIILVAAFSGTQRVWYLRAFRGDTMHGREVLPLTWAFVGRFLRLGLVMMLIGVPFFVLAPELDDGTRIIGVACYWLLMDLMLTFVVPALAYTTHSVREAFRIGHRMITATWPTSKWYVFTPGLATATLIWTRPSTSVGRWLVITLGVLGGLLALWFKGAIAAYYLRRHPETTGDGAAYEDSDDASWRWSSLDEPGAPALDDGP